MSRKKKRGQEGAVTAALEERYEERSALRELPEAAQPADGLPGTERRQGAQPERPVLGVAAGGGGGGEKMIDTKPTMAQRLTISMIRLLPENAMPEVVKASLDRMEEKQRDKALYEAVRKYKGKVHFHKDPVRKAKEV
jgi:hypothetical protein